MHLHVIQADDPQATPFTLAQIAQRAAHEEPGIVIAITGPTLPMHTARELLPKDAVLVGAPDGKAWRVLPALKATAKNLKLKTNPPKDGVHVWSPRMLSHPVTRYWIKKLGAPRITCTLTRAPAKPKSIARLPKHVQVRLVAGVSVAEGSLQRETEKLPPFALQTAGDRTDLRTAWGIAPEQDASTRVAVLVADNAACVDGLRTIITVGIADEILSQTGQRLSLVVPPQLLHAAAAQHVARGMEAPYRLLVDERADHPWQLLPGADAALVLSGGDTPNAVALAQQCGLPSVIDGADRKPQDVGYELAQALRDPVSV